MDGEEGEEHPFIAAKWWFNDITPMSTPDSFWEPWKEFKYRVAKEILGHSRFYAEQMGMQVSRLFYADKLAIYLYPRWLYLLISNASGEIHEYMRVEKHQDISNRKTQLHWLIEVQCKTGLMGFNGSDWKK